MARAEAFVIVTAHMLAVIVLGTVQSQLMHVKEQVIHPQGDAKVVLIHLRAFFFLLLDFHLIFLE